MALTHTANIGSRDKYEQEVPDFVEKIFVVFWEKNRYAYEERLWSLRSHHYCSLYSTDLHLKSRLSHRFQRHLEFAYHCLQLNTAFANSFQCRLCQTTSSHCDNYDSVQIVQHIILECPIYIDEHTFYKQQTETSTQVPVAMSCSRSLYLHCAAALHLEILFAVCTTLD